jgi:hypothetical protein
MDDNKEDNLQSLFKQGLLAQVEDEVKLVQQYKEQVENEVRQIPTLEEEYVMLKNKLPVDIFMYHCEEYAKDNLE